MGKIGTGDTGADTTGAWRPGGGCAAYLGVARGLLLNNGVPARHT